ncbi:hypothetical protein [Oceanobacillus sp. Castelsardo]|uniref:hypothetical protein n=1 Tax=Oceanobacillus sp. Castelsardo TaxID=1851204 RepID=UPI000838A908|nr:hypothetical protein [Oceanobacillus sp. Castelsardo]
MSVAARKLDQYANGVCIDKFETSLQEISDQIRIMDQKLIMKTENEITYRYENQRFEISKLEDSIKKYI